MRFQFEISDQTSETTFSFVKEMFLETFRDRNASVKMEDSPKSFTYQMKDAHGTVFFQSVKNGTQITITTALPPSSYLIWVIGFSVFYFLYGPIGGFIGLFFAFIIFLPMFFFTRIKQRTTIGVRFHEVLEGINFR